MMPKDILGLPKFRVQNFTLISCLENSNSALKKYKKYTKLKKSYLYDVTSASRGGE